MQLTNEQLAEVRILTNEAIERVLRLQRLGIVDYSTARLLIGECQEFMNRPSVNHPRVNAQVPHA